QTWLQVRRVNYLLFIHASRWHGQRSRFKLLSLPAGLKNVSRGGATSRRIFRCAVAPLRERLSPNFCHWRTQLRLKLLLITPIVVLSIAHAVVAQNPSAALASLPEADMLIYASPQRILNDAAPRVMSPAEITK